ncbi:apolipoprotein N-acyltransferase [uncultured Nocardioides sp.]|uniref:apolipoprotein N-acyltransferase n=1 Tax=uncultured Nocardioides sp. TaxID=198441 RepID=UPI0025E4851A|nr:apolipoprotein N-acyltransferase [uncultured Nocardioides sp.]
MLLRSLAALAAGVGLALAFEPVGLVVLIPLSLAVLLVCLHGLPARRAWLPALLFGGTFCFLLMFWMRAVGPDAWMSLSALETAFFAPLGAGVALLMRLRSWPVWTAFLWVAIETIRGSWPVSGMPWGRLSYAVAGTPWAEALPWFGFSGVSLLLALSGTTLAWLVLGGWRSRRTALVAVAAVLLPVAAAVVVPWTTDRAGSVNVAAVQGNVPGTGNDLVAVHREVTGNHVDATVELAERVASGEVERPDLVVWPENSTAVDPFRDVEVNTGIRRAVEAVGVPVLVGGIVDAPAEDEVLNQGIVWDPVTGAGERYTKRHPVPFGEFIPWRDSLPAGNFSQLRLIPRDMAAGTRVEPLRVAGVLVADAICFDIAYDDGIHDQVGRGGQLLTVQTSNASFMGTNQIEQQFEITRLRALETGRYVVVAAVNGVSGVIDPEGTVLDSAAARTQDVLVREVELRNGLTPAVRMGPWPGRACVALALVGLLIALTRRREAARPPRAEEPVRAPQSEPV